MIHHFNVSAILFQQKTHIFKEHIKKKKNFISRLFHPSFMRTCSSVILQVLAFVHPAALKQIQVPDVNKEAELVILNALMTMSLAKENYITN